MPSDARAIDRRWGEPLWSAALDVPPAALPERVEVAVVGAGFAGLSAALALARAGVRPHVLEAGRVGDGASGRSGGIALEGTAEGRREGVERCLDHLRALVASAEIACDLELGGCLEVRHEAGAAEGRSWPDLGGGRLVVDRTVPGGSLDPGALVAGLARAALRAGAAIHEGARVAAWEPGPPVRLHVRGARVLADRVLLAIDALPAGWLRAAEVRPALTLALATEPLPERLLAELGLGATPFYTTDLPYLWGRATRKGRLVIGAGLAFDRDGDLERVALSRDDVRDSFARLETRVRGLHPDLARAAISHRWGGPIAFRPGLAPVFAEVAAGVVAAGAYAGHGVALSLQLGALAAAWLREGGRLPAWGAA